MTAADRQRWERDCIAYLRLVFTPPFAHTQMLLADLRSLAAKIMTAPGGHA